MTPTINPVPLQQVPRPVRMKEVNHEQTTRSGWSTQTRMHISQENRSYRGEAVSHRKHYPYQIHELMHGSQAFT